MKVVVLGKYSEDESTTDGALRYAVGLCRALESIEDIDLHIVTLGDKNLSKRIGQKTLHVIPRRRRPLEIALFGFFPLVKKVLQINPTIIHCIGTTQPYGLPALYLAKQHGYRVVVSTLGIVQVEASYWFRSPLYSFHRVWYPWIERRVLRTFPVIALTENVRDRVSHLTKQPVYVIPPGIDEQFFALKRVNVEKKLVICVSVIHPRKGLLDLLEAIKLLSDHDLSVRLVHAGKVTSRDYYRRLCEYIQMHNLSQKVLFLGEVSQADLERLLQRATLLVLPSYEESFGLAVAEAMAVGVPVVATRVGGLQNLVEEGRSGLLAEPHCPECLAERIESILTNPQLAARLSEEGRRRARRYAWPRIADQTYALYKRILMDGEKV